MSILIMNSFRGKNIPYHEWLNNTSETVFLLCSDQQKTNQLPYRFSQSFADYEKNTAVENTAKIIIEKHHIKSIIAKSECDLLRAGKLREQFHIAGQTYQQALAFRDKVVMKSILEKANISIPAHRRIQCKQDAVLFSQQYGFPLVLKPVDGAGSLNTEIIDTIDALAKIPDTQFQHNMEIEKYIAGDMYHVDGIVLDGKTRFIYPSKYFSDCLQYQQNKSSGSCLLDVHHPLRERLIEFTQNVLAALPTPMITTFHAEIFHTPDDQLVFCEIASRTGGVRIREMIETAFQIDLDKIWIQAQANQLDDTTIIWRDQPTQLAGWILIPPREGILMRFPENHLPDGIVVYQKNAEIGKHCHRPEKSSDCVASFVAVGETEKQVIDRLMQAEVWFEKNVEWHPLGEK